MISLVDVILVCGAFYVGIQTLVNRSSKKKNLWLAKPGSPIQKVCLPFSTRIYIIRCWKERTWQGHESVMRYALEDPASGRRYGYTTAETLLKTLSMELTSTQEPQIHTELTTIANG